MHMGTDYMKKLLFIALMFVSTNAFAGDLHNRSEGHRVVYTVVDSSGNAVTGQTVSLQVQRVSDDRILDFNDNSFKSSGWTTRYATMNYQPDGEYYSRTVTVDTAKLATGDYVMCVSNDDATYGDFQCEVVSWSNMSDLIKINR